MNTPTPVHHCAEQSVDFGAVCKKAILVNDGLCEVLRMPIWRLGAAVTYSETMPIGGLTSHSDVVLKPTASVGDVLKLSK